MIEILILDALMNRDYTMYAIQKHIIDYFSALTKPSFGAIKPALNRLEEKGCLTCRKIMSDGGKLSGFYSITTKGKNELCKLLLQNLSENPLQFLSDARIKLACCAHLSQEERKKLFFQLKSLALTHKNAAEKTLNNEYSPLNFYQKIVLDNALCEYNNLITIIEGFEKDNARNS